MRLRLRTAIVIGLTGASLAVTGPSRATDVGVVAGSPMRIDITETSIFAVHGDNRNNPTPYAVQQVIDDHYTEWINRLNVTMAWASWQAGLRLDTATYLVTPNTSDLVASGDLAPSAKHSADVALSYRYRDQYLVSYLPSKLYVTYGKPTFELTLGDGYVSFGRGLVLSMRKIDELGVDTSLQGAKVVGRFGGFTVTAVAGLSNPGRVDEATATALRDPDPNSPAGYLDSWSRDAIAGVRGEARLGTTSFAVQASDVHRREDIAGNLGISGDPTLLAQDVAAAGASLAIPNLSASLPLNLYTEIAFQHRAWFDEKTYAALEKDGLAAYLSASLTQGAVTASVEGKHYRSYYPVHLNADPSNFGAFKAVQYNAPPTVERITQDSLFDNSCVTGARARVDVRATKSLIAYASGAYFANWSEQQSGSCTPSGSFGVTTVDSHPNRNDVLDGYVGLTVRSQTDASYALIEGGVRRDTQSQNGVDFYREAWIQGDFVKTLNSIWSLELNTLHRQRYEPPENWHEGDTALALKHGSAYFFFLGHEYTTHSSEVKPGAFLVDGGIQHFVNGGAQVKFSEALSVRLFVGQQRGALKCVSGVCRQFPAFEGAKVEAVIRY
ncbi:MAG: hypothetical protein ACHREM_14015 [Polyangiales bacterium]